MARRLRVSDTSSKISAVKLVRELTGFGLKESLDHVEGKTWFTVERDDSSWGSILGDARRNGVTFEFDPPLGGFESRNELPVAIGVSGNHSIRYRSGPNKINAIKLTREINPGLGLKEAKDLVEGCGVIRSGVSYSEALRITGLFREIESVVTVEQGNAATSSLPPPSVPSPSSSAPPPGSPNRGASARAATPAKPARPATHVYGRPDDADDF